MTGEKGKKIENKNLTVVVNVVCIQNVHIFKYCFCKHCWLGINFMLLNASPHCFSSNNELNEIFMRKKKEGLPSSHLGGYSMFKQIYFLLV